MISAAYPLSPFEFLIIFAALLLVILTLGNDAILVAYQINTILMQATAHFAISIRLAQGVKSISINDSLKETN